MKRVLCLLCLSLLFLNISCINDDTKWEESGTTEVVVGERVPVFTIIDNRGVLVDNNYLAGKTSVLVFFNTRCGDCRKELPVVQKLYDEYGDYEDIVFITISLAEDAASIADFWSKNGLTLPYSAQPDKKLYHLFAYKAIPMLYIIDRNQVIRYIHDDNPIVDFHTLCEEFNEVRIK